jgi:hypothetical protein
VFLVACQEQLGPQRVSVVGPSQARDWAGPKEEASRRFVGTQPLEIGGFPLAQDETSRIQFGKESSVANDRKVP